MIVIKMYKVLELQCSFRLNMFSFDYKFEISIFFLLINAGAIQRMIHRFNDN